ncbi:class I SAM-dependent rRNA methyltransferase [Fervidobacterium thailandense]|uniref:SAM-dependent methyltransferase n=1 Tax=Fervidobacterium thailandense TaxID=1008305 RepID=A0A1E3G273_9BACT|nr:class I SAM-dependent rRNA methyltransferase [Fervidobacterium thailandense]ODN30210.1 SAM-dependent methyltransferase [Fervidobacterium thailandense]
MGGNRDRLSRVVLKKDIKRRVLNGHPWIYDNEIERIEGDLEDGSLVDVFTFAGQFIGRGYINRLSKITIRLLTRKPEEIDTNFWKRRVIEALKNRYQLVKENAFRVLFGEADGVPGLIVDKFSDYLVLQVNTLGIYKRLESILPALLETLNPSGVFVIMEGSSIQKEGLEEQKYWIYGSGPELIPYEVNGIKFLADLKGQKTGAFLDQRENAKMLSQFAHGRVCLDCFSYTGNFGMHLLKHGAKHVTFVDYSERALAVAREVAKLNGFTNCDFVVANAFDFLKKLYGESKLFDLIVLDPPSFAKSAANRESAYKGYKEINYRSMKLLRNDGILATSSCTQVISQQEFENILVDAGTDARVVMRILHRGGQPLDHPQIYNILETMYLKFLILQISHL